MAEESPTPPKRKKPAKTATGKTAPVFTPTPEAKAQSTQKRIIALVLWVVAIALEAVAIFWLLRPPFDELVANKGFPQWRWWTLLGFLVLIGALSIIGSQLWKQANRLDPASSKEKFRFFVQNQLGAIIALIAFLPLIIMIFLNKDMDSKQKGIAGGVGIAVALAAILLGIDFKPLSQEQAAVESQVVTQLVGQDLVWWSAGGGVMHLCEGVSDLKNVKTEISSGTTAEAFAAGKTGITLQIQQELNQCGLATPENIDEIVAWVRQARGVA
ncbi:MAG: ABC transporter ATP-binding protein [Propionibacteriaceae bacterium]|nr:ABC transporter ATP-binding protein [Propionibacteriaceae bacterium]